MQEKKGFCLPDFLDSCIPYKPLYFLIDMSFDASDTISFFTPCLQWKYILAYKGHGGFNGFIAPFYNKYLHRLERLTITQTGPAPSVQVFENEYQVDRLIGDTAQIRNSPVGYIPFPFTSPPAADDPAWIVRDDYFSNTETGPIDFGQVTIRKEVFLSQPYTLAALDADTDALIDAINPDDLPWGTVTPASYDGFGGVATDNASFNLEQYGHTVFNAALTPPQQHFFPPIVFQQAPDLFEFQTEPRFDSAAGYVYLPNGLPTAENGFDIPCGYAKWVSWVRMAGKYCLKTYYYDYAQKTIRSDCVTGRGSCASSFKVAPPPVPVIGQNAYTVLTPNGQC